MDVFSSFYMQESSGIGAMMDATNGCRSMKSGLAYRDTIRSQAYRKLRYQIQSEGFWTVVKKKFSR